MGSMIPEGYKGKYKGASDWLGEFIDDICVDDKDGLNLDRLLDLAAKNGADVDKFRGDVGKKNAPGRLRMTIGNMLRSRARKRHGLFNLNGDWVEATDEFIEDRPLVETRDGEKIKEEKETEAA